MQEFPQLGVGISYRPIWRQAVLTHREQLGCLEVIAEHYLSSTLSIYRNLSHN